jgi:hypothetical protein
MRAFRVFWKWCDKRWCSVGTWGYSWPRGLLHWEPSKQKKRINSDHGPTGLGCDKRTQRTLHELFTQKRMFFKLSDYHIPIPWRILTVLLFLWCATWIPTKTPVMLAFFYQHQPEKYLRDTCQILSTVFRSWVQTTITVIPSGNLPQRQLENEWTWPI